MLLNPLPNEPRDLFSESDKENQEFPLDHEKLFSWVSGLPYKNSAVVSEVDDFRNGLVFSELLVEILPDNKDFLKGIETLDLSYANCLKNLDIVLKEIQTKFDSPEYISSFTASELFENDQKLIILLAFLYNEKHHHNNSEKSERSTKKAVHHQHKPKIAGKPPLGPTITGGTVLNVQSNTQPKPQVSVSASKPTEEKSKVYQIIQPRNPEVFLQKTIHSEKKSDPPEVDQIKTMIPQPESLPEPKKQVPFITNQSKPVSLGNFRHFNQITELSDVKASPLPYINNSEIEERNKVALNLSSKFNTEDFGTNGSPEKSNFSNIWFNPKPNLNKFSDPRPKNRSEIIEEKPNSKIHLHSILKNSARNLKSTSNNKSVSIEKNPETEIDVCLPVTKQKLFNWLISIDLLKENLPNIIEKLPKICRNGVIYADIINRLESRGDSIKGICRKPKKSAELRANFQRIFDFFSRHEKMNKRLLYSYEPFIEGRENEFWAFLDDIWHFYHLKISSADIRFRDKGKSVAGKRTSLLNESNRRLLFNSSKKSEFSNASYDEICQDTQYNSGKTTSVKPGLGGKNYETRAWTLPQKIEEPLNENPSSTNKLAKKEDSKATFQKSEVLEWLKSLGFQSYFPKFSAPAPFENPLKNGTILSQVLSRLHLARFPTTIKNPQSIQDCEKNIDFIFQALRKLPVTLPSEFVRKIPLIPRLDELAIFEILSELKGFQEKSARKSVNNPNTSRLSAKSLNNSPLQRSLSQNESSRCLFRINSEVESIENRIFNWIKDKGILAEKQLEDFSSLFPLLSNGVVFCDLAEKMTGATILGVNRKPLTDKAKRINIQKAVDVLRERKILSLQAGNIAVDEIFLGNYAFIMEVLEALYNFETGGKCGQFLSNRETKLQRHEIKKEVKIDQNNEKKLVSVMENAESSVKLMRFARKHEKSEPVLIANVNAVENNDKKGLDSWFRKIGFQGIIENLDFNQKIWPEFKDGVILCKLIEKLENREILGVNYKPKSVAACKANIKRILELLRTKKDMSLKYLYEEDTLYECFSENIAEFLLQIKHAYRLNFRFSGRKAL